MYLYENASGRRPIPNPEGTPVVPLPPLVGNPENTPVVPLPPLVGNPENTPVAPLPPLVGNPENTPVVPLPPLVGNPAPGPSYPVQSGFGQLRFLHAVPGAGPVRISVDGRSFGGPLGFGTLSSYGRIADGFHSVAIMSASAPRRILYQGSFPLRAGETITFAIVNTARGIDLTRIPEIPCNTRYRNRSCIRAVNLVYNSPDLDVLLDDGRTVFADIRYREATPYKQAYSKNYDFYVAASYPQISPRANALETPGPGDALVSFSVNALPGASYSIYLLGSWSTTPDIRVLIVEGP